MKHAFSFLCIILCIFLFSSCNEDEGFGGNSSIEGYVYKVIHYDDNLSFRTEIIPAAKENVYIIFGNKTDDFFGDKTDAGNNGLFRFDYLRPGNYVLYAFSEPADGKKEPVFVNVNMGKKTNARADTLFIHTGKAYGTAMIKGNVYTTYYHNGNYRDEGLGTGMRAYIKHDGEEGYFDDIRVIDGVFYFQKLLPGKYIVGVETEDKDTEAVSLVTQSITITDTGIIYECPEVFKVNTAV